MVIVAVLCLCAAAVTTGLGVWQLARPRSSDPVRQVLRTVAPTQLAGAAMLAAGGTVALSTHPQTAMLVVVVCIVGAVGTVAAGCYQSAKAVARKEATVGGCAGACASCTLSCN